MKKINLLMLAVVVSIIGFFGSCTKDSNNLDLSITAYVNGTIQDAVTVGSGTDVPCIFNVNAPGKLKTIVLTKKVGANTTTELNKTTSFLKDTFDIVNYTALNVTATTELTLTVTDKNDVVTSKTVTITVTAGAALTTYTDKILGAQTSANGSSFLSVDGTVLQIADAKANSNKVDFMYYYSSGDQSTIVAPSDAAAATQFNNANTGVATWSVKNATKLKKLAGVTFESITTSSAIEDVSSTGSTKITTLAVGDVVAFMTASTSAKASKKGVFKVTNISAATTAGSITIQVKVE